MSEKINLVIPKKKYKQINKIQKLLKKAEKINITLNKFDLKLSVSKTC